ncbi:MAG: SNF2-related protein [Bryobacteraceae bacterium]
MNLASLLSDDFESTVRNRGKIYYWQSRVRIRHGTDREVQASVRGSRTYDVNLDWADGTLSLDCDCEYYDSVGPCKHLWATILAADAKGYLAEAKSGGKLYADYSESDGHRDFDLDGDEADREEFALHTGPRPRSVVPQPAPKGPAWMADLSRIASRSLMVETPETWPAKREILYVVDGNASKASGDLVMGLGSHDRKADGGWTHFAFLTLKRQQIPHLPPPDREIVAALAGGTEHHNWDYENYSPVAPSRRVAYPLAANLLPQAVRTGRCYLGTPAESGGSSPLSWDEGGPWQFRLAMRRGKRDRWMVTGQFARGEERMDVAEPALVLPGGFVFTRERAAALAADTAFAWLAHFREGSNIEAPEPDGDALLAALLGAAGAPEVEVPEELRFEEVQPAPRPALRIRANIQGGPAGKLAGDLSFDYEGRAVEADEKSRGFFDSAARRFVRRNPPAEAAAKSLLESAGLRYRCWGYNYTNAAWEIVPSKLPRLVRTLVEAGWHIEADGKIFRRPGAFRMGVSSGVDWFELHGDVEYGETSAKLPALLEAVRRGDSMVRLDDGTYGVLPEEWLKRIGTLAGMGEAQDGHMRFRRSQAGLLDALLAAQPEATCDETFTRMRQEMRAFAGIEAALQPVGFVGQLRDYQREGLGWMEFLRRFAFGGCLADDMGVGKTAQVLALFETRRELRAGGQPVAPSLVVVPRSLVFNWKQESERFTPQLRVLDYTGLAREGADFAGYDVVVTTYGTLRRDAVRLKDVEFDYVVLDESQAIKNAGTESAKAVRLLRGNHRLALSGTPVENHLGELWSLFEFLNPGMLGAASVFKLAGAAARNPDEETRALLAHALRPFILRRTKEQVARELPAKTEQTVYCEMAPAQRRLYNELKQHYRQSLLGRIEREGMAKSKIQVLEALLRLRQAACHPGLLDQRRLAEPSAKLDVLLEQLEEVIGSGHKALVFSQFTSFLAIVRHRLEAAGMVYEYLDGATRDRQERVERFQNDPDCPLFLISLKAGGLGLNLTAAGYVFLLDPWWNPAVEAQAVDRAHRIGQTRQVFAYRLIAKDTVEEKVLELQKSKRDLAAAIIGEDNSLIRDLHREDLELLLS